MNRLTLAALSTFATLLAVVPSADARNSRMELPLQELVNSPQAKEAGIEGLDETLKGPVAIAFVKGDFVEAAKTLRDFAKTNKTLIVKGGYADGTVYDAEGFMKLADLESREVLLSKMAGALKGTMAKAAFLFVALPTKAVRTIDALREKQEKAA